jgi:DNA-3-methyladenine glycosylase II
MRQVIAACGDTVVWNDEPADVYTFLVYSVMGQQVSAKAADTIYGRFLELYDGSIGTPQQLIATPTTTLRSVGLSGQKVQYLYNIAQFALDNGTNNTQLQQMPNETAINHLTQIKGVGQWTAEMVLMYALKRPDVFSIGDLAIRQAATQLYALPPQGKPNLQALLQLSQQWQPYCTIVCLYLWQYRDLGLLKTQTIN